MKLRILLCGEFSGLKTGYSGYQYELLSKLHATGKYEIAEHSSYIDENDPKINDVPWKVFTNLPKNEKERSIYESNPKNQFGQFRFTETVLKYKPHVIISILDPWMSDFILKHPYRDLYKFAWMATVDAAPLRPEWLYDLSQVDAVFTYTDWAKSLLESYGLNVFSSAPYGTKFRRLNGKQIKQQFGINKKLIGFVSRNQRRKLFPALMRAFSSFIKKAGNDYALYLHTSYPDNMSWDIPALIQEYDIADNVYFTYHCRETGMWFPLKYSGPITENPITHRCTLFFPNVNHGLSNEEMNKVYSMMDLYVQFANAEGFGLSQVDAAAAGVPIMSVDYSAMCDIVRKLGGVALPVQNLSREIETNREMAIPDESVLVDELVKFFSQPESLRLKKGFETYQLAQKHYSWDSIVECWMSYFDTVNIEEQENKWRAGYRGKEIVKIDNVPSNKEFLRLAILNIMGEESKANSFFECLMLKDLNFGFSNKEEFNREKVLNILAGYRRTFNELEHARCVENKIQ